MFRPMLGAGRSEKSENRLSLCTYFVPQIPKSVEMRTTDHLNHRDQQAVTTYVNLFLLNEESS